MIRFVVLILPLLQSPQSTEDFPLPEESDLFSSEKFLKLDFEDLSLADIIPLNFASLDEIRKKIQKKPPQRIVKPPTVTQVPSVPSVFNTHEEEIKLLHIFENTQLNKLVRQGDTDLVHQLDNQQYFWQQLECYLNQQLINSEHDLGQSPNRSLEIPREHSASYLK